MADRIDYEAVALPHLTAVYRTAFALAGRADQAEDLAQLTFLKALERFESFQPGTNCRSWLLQILRNTWIDQLRHRNVVGHEVSIEEDRLIVVEDEDGGSGQTPDDDSLLERFSDQQVIEALLELSPEQRLALLLVDVERLSIEEAAEVMDVAGGTIKSRASRARTHLRRRLELHARDLGFSGRRP